MIEARDGEEALRLAESLRPDLVLLDVMMPGLSGLEVLAELRGRPELAATPVVILTARAQRPAREEAERAGADRFMTKPFSPAELVATVEELLGR